MGDIENKINLVSVAFIIIVTKDKVNVTPFLNTLGIVFVKFLCESEMR